MASRITFSLAKLAEQAEQAIQGRIDDKALEIGRLEEHLDLYETHLAEWRAAMEEVLFRLNHDFEHMTPEAIANFRFAPVPKRDTFALERAHRELQALQAEALKITAKAASLVPDADGNISLTKTQLAEYFSL